MIIPFILATSIAMTPLTGPIITEVQIGGNPHIVLFNQEENEIDISGFKLRKRSSTGKEYSVRVFPQGSMVAGKGNFTWANSKNDYHLSVKADVWSTAGISRNNSVALLSPSDEIIDSVAWGDGENQFGSNALSNPTEGQIIKRSRSNGEYLITGDNSVDFFLYPEKRSELTEEIEIVKRSQEERKGASPVTAGAGIAVLSSISILMLKRSL